MNRILAGALALTLLGTSVAVAQPDNHDRNQQGGRQDAGRHQGGQQQATRHDGGRGNQMNRRHRTHKVCHVRHHRRVCYQQRW